MAQYHVFASVLHQGNTNGGAVGLMRYLERQQEGPGEGQGGQAWRYITRDGDEKDDLVASRSEHLPRWASDGEHFWAMADKLERKPNRETPKEKQRLGVVARHYQFTLPRELSRQGREALAEDIRATFFAHFAHTWALHCPPSRDGSGENPHLHVMFSPRRDDQGQATTPEEWFSQKANGARKERSWDHKRTLQGVRYEFAVLANAALEREGIPAAISSERLKVRGLERRGKHYHQFAKEPDIQAMQVEQAALHQNGTHAMENLINLEAWRQQKTREGITDISREAIVDLTRDRFWQHDRSTAREQERQESLLRAIEREYGRTGRARDTQDRERAKTREKTRQWQSPFPRSSEDGMRQGVHVQFERESA